jgi:RNA polymerase sigma-70 factor (ECF subfamily)
MSDDDPASNAGLTRDEFVAAYEASVGSVFGYLARRVGRETAEELTAQTFAEAWASRTRYDRRRAPVRVWLLGIATNVMRHWYREEGRQMSLLARSGRGRPASPVHEEAIVEGLHVQEELRRVAGLLADLGSVEREIVWLWAVGELSYAQIAEVVGFPVGTVKSKLSRARVQLRTATGTVGAAEPNHG